MLVYCFKLSSCIFLCDFRSCRIFSGRNVFLFLYDKAVSTFLKFKPFQANISFLYPLKTENQSFSDIEDGGIEREHCPEMG